MIEIEVFTDPMMGLSYESEPFLRYLESHYYGKIKFQYRMAGLVRDVEEFMLPAEIALGTEEGIKQYNKRLANIYLAEESISGLPINMTNFRLFSPEERSSLPMNKAYKAIVLMAPDKAERFLYRLRYETIAKTRPLTKRSEILRLVEEMGFDLERFKDLYDNGSAEAEMHKDFEIQGKLGARALLSYLIRCDGKEVLLQGVARIEHFVKVITNLSQGKALPTKPEISQKNLEELLEKHPLISHQELQTAFELKDEKAVKEFIKPMLDSGQIKIAPILNSWFVEKTI